MHCIYLSVQHYIFIVHDLRTITYGVLNYKVMYDIVSYKYNWLTHFVHTPLSYYMLCTSIALKIQVSGATADLLHTLRGYVLTCRGTLNVKVRLSDILIVHHTVTGLTNPGPSGQEM